MKLASYCSMLVVDIAMLEVDVDVSMLEVDHYIVKTNPCPLQHVGGLKVIVEGPQTFDQHPYVA